MTGGMTMAPSELGIKGVGPVEEIGRGGFGVVYRATETELGRPVAIKVLLGDFDERAKMRFDRERLAMGSLSGHPNIVTVYRSGFTSAGQPFLLMEYLDGGSIANQLQQRGRLPWPDVARVGIEIAGALATAHEAGVLHRDVKPGNILVSASGTAKLADFGIARLHGAPETRSAVITASVAHAPPEVIGGVRPDERADIYSLASTLFELAWGSPAFLGPDDESLVPMLSRIATGALPDLGAVGVPPPLREVIATAMAKEKDRRFPTARDFARALESASSVSTRPASTRPAGTEVVSSGATQAVAPLVSAPSSDIRPRSGSKPSVETGAKNRRIAGRPLMAGALLAVVCLAAVGAFLLRPNDTEAPDQELRSSDSADPATIVTSASETTSSTTSSNTSSTTTPPPSIVAPTTAAESPIARTRQVFNETGAISVLVPEAWAGETSDAVSLLVAEDLEAALADEWTKGVYLEAVRNTPEQNPGGFAPDVTLNQLIAESECTVRERGPYADSNFGGSYAVLDQCGDSTLSSYYLVAAPGDLNMVVLVAIQFESPEEDEIVQLTLDSVVWTIGALP